MSGLSKKVGFFRHNGDRGFTPNGVAPIINVSAVTSNVANVDLTDTITFTISSNLPDKIVYWKTTSNLSQYFSDSISSGSILLDSFGNATLTKTILINGTNAGNVNFDFEFRTGDAVVGDIVFEQPLTIVSSNVQYSITGGNVLYPPVETILSNGEKLIEFTPRGSGVNQTFNFQLINGKNINARYLVHGGRGSRGGYNTSTNVDIFRYRCGGEGGGTGGGGGGAVKSGNISLIENSNTTVIVGRGGVAYNPTPGTGTRLVGESGYASYLNSIEAVGGGYGGGFYVSGQGIASIGSSRYQIPAGTGGGSPGGNANVSAVFLNTTTTLGGAANTGNIYAGGNGLSDSYIYGNGSTFTTWTFMMGGGGGGAGGPGGSATSSTPGAGGAGIANDITGNIIYYGSGLPGRGFSSPSSSTCLVGGQNDPGPRYGGDGVVYLRFKPYQYSLQIS